MNFQNDMQTGQRMIRLEKTLPSRVSLSLILINCLHCISFFMILERTDVIIICMGG